jgi:hypothetical protein
MTAEEKIRFTIAEYCHRTGTGDFDGWVKLFAEDGSFRRGRTHSAGRDTALGCEAGLTRCRAMIEF